MPFGVNTKLTGIAAQLSSLLDFASDIRDDLDAISASLADFHGDFNTLAAFLNTAIGTFSEAEPGTILAVLRQIQVCICQLAGGTEPTGASPNGCDEPVSSLGEPLISSGDYPGRSFILWDPTFPQGIEAESFLDPALVSNVELHLTGVGTYYIWVQSNCETFKLDPTHITTWPTNEWVPVPGPAFVALSVAEGCSAIGYICVDPAQGFVDCVQRGSLPGDADFVDGSGTHFPGTPAYIPLDGLAVGECVTDISWGTPTKSFHTTDECHILAVDAFGWTFQRIDGSAMQVSWIVADLTSDQHHTWSTSDTSVFTMPDHTAYLLIDNAVGGPGDGDDPFTCRICPPSEA